ADLARHRGPARSDRAGRQRDSRPARGAHRPHVCPAGGVTMETFLRDLRFALRGLARTPGFTVAAVLALALGIGATTAIFSVVHAVLLRSLGWGEESRLVSVRGNFPSQDLVDIPVSALEYVDLKRATFLQTVGIYSNHRAALQSDRAE